MQWDKFKIYADLVETKSFTDAAKLNGISKAAVSTQLRELERHFNVLLIDRAQNRFQLSAEGLRVYAGAREMINQYEGILSDLQETKQIVDGTISLSAIPSIGLHVLPSYLEKFRNVYPAVSVQVKYRRTKQVYGDLLGNAADFGLVAFPEEEPRIEAYPFLDDHFVLIAPPGHPLAGDAAVTPAMLAGQKFIGLDQAGPTHEAIDRILHECRVDPVMRFDNIEMVKRAVACGAGIAIIPNFTVSLEVKRGSLAAMAFAGRQFARPLAILYRRGRILMPAMKRFLATLGAYPSPLSLSTRLPEVGIHSTSERRTRQEESAWPAGESLM